MAPQIRQKARTTIKVVVTGAAGFIGSNLSAALLARGDEVIGIDSFTDYYDPVLKRANSDALAGSAFTLVEADVSEIISDLLSAERPDAIVHLAGQPGVRKSWGRQFGQYTSLNVGTTQALLEAAVTAQKRPRVLNASSSSIYGERQSFPSSESDLPHPHSPYGVTKLAAEHLAGLYRENFGLDAVSFRFFTVYGPAQRPDMAFRRFIEAGLDGNQITVFGSGEQVRDFTYVGDIVTALVLGLDADHELPGVMNLSGGSTASVNETLAEIERIVERELLVTRVESSKGDVTRTGGDNTLARTSLGWAPQMSLAGGLAAEAEWVMRRR